MRKFFIVIFVLSLSSIAFGGWTPWAPIPNGLAIGEPSVVTTKDGSIHVMVRGNDNSLWWTRSKDGGKTWYGSITAEKWSKVGGILTSSPSCLEPIPNVVECYVRNNQKGVSQIDRINEAWGNWADVGGVISTNIAATATNQDIRSLVVVNSKGNLARRTWIGGKNSVGWSSWTNMDDEVGVKSWVACSDLGGNTANYFGGNVEIQDWDRACVINLPGGNFSLIKDFDGKAHEVMLNFAKAASDYPASVKLHSLSTALDFYFVDKDKKMKHGMYKFGSGWAAPFEAIGNGLFSSGPSCDGAIPKFQITGVCTGRGLDGAIWYSIRRKIDLPIDPGTVSTGKVLFNAGNAGADLNKMYARPSAGTGMTLKINPADAVKCESGYCDFNLGVLIVRQNTGGFSKVQAMMTGTNKFANGNPVVYAAEETVFDTGVKTLAASVRIVLKTGATTPVTVRIIPAGGKFSGPKIYESFVVNVEVKSEQ